MFDQFKAMGQIAQLLKNKEQLRQTADELRDRLDATEVEGEAGGGAVRCLVSGTMRVRSVTLDPPLAAGMGQDDKTRQLASDLIAEAVNDGLRKAFIESRRLVQAEAEALGLGDLGPMNGPLGDMLGGPEPRP